jgi:hypothetical protein
MHTENVKGRDFLRHIGACGSGLVSCGSGYSAVLGCCGLHNEHSVPLKAGR